MSRERATRMALDALVAPDRARGAIACTAEQLGIHMEALRAWVRKAQADGVTAGSVDSDRDVRLAELEKENRELRSWTVHSDEGRFRRPSQGRAWCPADL